MYVQADVAFVSQDRLAGVQPDTHPQGYTIRPGVRESKLLHRRGGYYGIGCAVKGGEEGITLRVDFMPACTLEGRTQQLAVHSKQRSIAVSELVQQLRRALDIGEE
jgi:hypothetical protein